MADSLGIKSKFAFKKDHGLIAGGAIVYPEIPAAGSLAANHMIPASGESVGLSLERAKDPALVGSGIQIPSSVVKKTAKGTVEGRLRYEGWERLILCAMGFESAITPGTPGGSPELADTGAYRHVFELDEDLQDEGWAAGERTGGSASDRKVRRGMLGEYKQVTSTEDWVWYSSMVDKMTVKATPSGVDMSFDLVAYDQVRGAYNHAAWTLPGSANGSAQCLFTGMRVRLGTRAGGVAACVDQGVNGIEISLGNNLAAEDQSALSGSHIVQPLRSQFREVTLKLDYPRYSADTNQSALDINSEMIAAVIFTGALIAGTSYLRVGFFFDSLQYLGAPAPIDSPGAIKESLTFQAHRVGSVTSVWNSYWPNVTTQKDCEMRCMIGNTISANYLNEN